MIRCVKTLDDHLARWWSYVDQSDPEGCWPWTGGTTSRGYGAFNMPVAGRTNYRVVGAHRWGFIHIVRPLEAGEVVCHTCDNPPCCRPAHWFGGTIAENNADRARKGRTRIAVGEARASARLTEAKVREIRKTYASGGTSMEKLAKTYGVGIGTIHRVISRTGWAHVD